MLSAFVYAVEVIIEIGASGDQWIAVVALEEPQPDHDYQWLRVAVICPFHDVPNQPRQDLELASKYGIPDDPKYPNDKILPSSRFHHFSLSTSQATELKSDIGMFTAPLILDSR